VPIRGEVRIAATAPALRLILNCPSQAHSAGNGSFLANHLPVTRDRLGLLATKTGATQKRRRLPEAVAESFRLARTTAQAPLLVTRAGRNSLADCGSTGGGTL